MGSMPAELSISADNKLHIRWSDGFEQVLAVRALRNACPCATCREKKHVDEPKAVTSLPVISAAEAAPLTILQMRPVGNYAYNIAFSDGHNSGIYTFEFLKAFAEPTKNFGSSG